MRFDYSDDFDPPALVIRLRVSDLGSSESIEFHALLDTGADMSMIPESLFSVLELRPIDRILAEGALSGGPIEVPTYLVQMANDGVRIGVVEVVVGHSDLILLGRDVLNQMKLIADGPAGTFELVLDDLGNGA